MVQSDSRSLDRVGAFLAEHRPAQIRFVQRKYAFNPFLAEDVVHNSIVKFLEWAMRQAERGDISPVSEPDRHLGYLKVTVYHESMNVFRDGRMRGRLPYANFLDEDEARSEDPFDQVPSASTLIDEIMGRECMRLLPEFFGQLVRQCRADLVAALLLAAQQHGCDSQVEEFIFIKRYLQHSRRKEGDRKRSGVTSALCRHTRLSPEALFTAIHRMKPTWLRLEQQIVGYPFDSGDHNILWLAIGGPRKGLPIAPRFQACDGHGACVILDRPETQPRGPIACRPASGAPGCILGAVCWRPWIDQTTTPRGYLSQVDTPFSRFLEFLRVPPLRTKILNESFDHPQGTQPSSNQPGPAAIGLAASPSLHVTRRRYLSRTFSLKVLNRPSALSPLNQVKNRM